MWRICGLKKSCYILPSRIISTHSESVSKRLVLLQNMNFTYRNTLYDEYKVTDEKLEVIHTEMRFGFLSGTSLYINEILKKYKLPMKQSSRRLA